MNLTLIKQILLLRKKSLIVLAIVFSITVALQFFISFYHAPNLEKMRVEWQKQRELEGRGITLQNRDLLYKNGLADLAKFDERIYPKSQFARFIGELFELAAKNSLELSSISYKPTLNKEEQMLDYQLTMAVSGKYSQLKKFINDLGSTTNILVIDSISLAASSASTDIVQLQLQLTSFFKMEAK